jgi:hypothetical protein
MHSKELVLDPDDKPSAVNIPPSSGKLKHFPQNLCIFLERKGSDIRNNVTILGLQRSISESAE